MCGIAGIFGYGDSAPPIDERELLRIREAMRLRGPDGAGSWVSADKRVGLGHRRLAILDPSDAGAQPMSTPDSALRITFNGEIYNFRDLRLELAQKGCAFRSNSDTEVLLHLYAEHGPEMVHALRGMYAFAIWDERQQVLFLARDPFGIKPLYYADNGRTFRFASQVKALLKGGAIETAPEPAGSVGFLVWGSVPEPFTLYRGVHALPAGTFMHVARGRRPVTSTFFDVTAELRQAEERARSAVQPFTPTIRTALDQSVRRHLVSDVSVGLFLSAGIDSAAIASAASGMADRSLQAITLAFEEFRGTKVDEAPLSGTVASLFGLRHTVSRVARREFESELPRILDAMDQPSLDGVNTYFVSRAAAEAGLKVALSGIGGDELFGGYPGFRQIPRAARCLGFFRHVPAAGRFSRRILARLMSAAGSSPKYAGLFEYGGSYGSAYLLRRALFMPWEADALLDPATVHAGLEKLNLVKGLDASAQGLRQPRSRVASLELCSYLRNQLLRDADWAGMAHSVEIRVPLVDVDLFRALAPLMVAARPPAKQDLARALVRPVPAEVVARAKTGFSTPVAEWMAAAAPSSPRTRGLRGWARRVLPAQPRTFRALVLVTDAFGGTGGIAKFNRDLVSAMASMPQCAEIVVAPRLLPSADFTLPPRTRVLSAAARSKQAFVRSVLSEARRGHFDLVFVGHINLAWAGIAAARAASARSALVVHGIDAWSRGRGMRSTAPLSRFDSVIGVSELTLSRFAAWSGVEPSRFQLLPNCVDLEGYRPGAKPTDLVERFRLADRTVLMTLGRLAVGEPGKGFDEVLEVLPSLARQVPNVSYLICGDGPDRARLESKTRELGLADRVVFTGYVPEARKPDYYRLADAFVLPSRGEGFGIVLIEALACGIPVLGSRIDAGREALHDGALGHLANPDDSRELEEALLATIRAGRGRVPTEVASEYSYPAFERRVHGIVGKLRSVVEAQAS